MKTTSIICILAAAACAHADTIELANGNKVEGKVLDENAVEKTLTVEFSLGGTLTQRTVPFSAVKAITVNGQRRTPGSSSAAPLNRSPGEVNALIAKEGASDPDWLKGTRSGHPKSLDLSWPERPQGGWNNQKNVGQYVWDVVNPNSSRWREGVRLMHDLVQDSPTEKVKQRAEMEMANMHFRFFQDYARAAWWWQKAGVSQDDASSVHLAECFWRLGSKQMALDLLAKSQFLHLDAIKLLGDMGETDRAIAMAGQFNAHDAWLLAGDACRLAGRMDEAQAFFEKVIQTPPQAGTKPDRVKRSQDRAQASLEALKLYERTDVSKIADGTYKGSSLGYEGQVEVSVKVRAKKIEDVKITQHKEKQYYSSMRDIPEQVIAKQSVKGVDATSRATITSEAIINAVAKALAQGAP